MVEGEGKPCKIYDKGSLVEEHPNLITQLALDHYDVVVADGDHLEESYLALAEKIDGLLAEGYSVVADYTGGTKTMGVALAMAATDRGQKLLLTTGPRTDLLRVRFGSVTEQSPTDSIQFHRTMKTAVTKDLQRYDYSGTSRLLEDMLRGTTLTRDQKQLVRDLRNWSAALDAWDRFQHNEAFELLSNLRGLAQRLEKVMTSRAGLDKDFEPRYRSTRAHGYEVLEDLILNAYRRAHQKRYDDAVARLYRALELLAQLRLKSAHGIETGSVEEEQVPQEYRSFCDFSSGRAKLGLFKAYELLKHLPGDSLGESFKTVEGSLRNALDARNGSILAHGFQPVDLDLWGKIEKEVVTFMKASLQSLLGKEYIFPEQLPSEVPLKMSNPQE